MNQEKQIQKRMVFIKFILTNGEITVDEEQAKVILRSEQQLIPIKDLQGHWTYETINKAFIVRTIKDFERMRWWNLEQEKIRQNEAAKDEAERIAKMSPQERAEMQLLEEENEKNITKLFADLAQSFKIGNK